MPIVAERSRTQRARSRRAAANDDVLINAAHHLLVEHGWDRLTPRGIAAEAGLSPRPAYTRFPNRVALARSLWSEHGSPALHVELAPIIASLLRSPPDVNTAVTQIHTLMTPSPTLIGCAELMGAAIYLPELHAAIVEDWVDVRNSVNVIDGDSSESACARIMYATAAVLGLLMTQRDPSQGPYSVATVVPELVTSLASPTPPCQLPADPAEHMNYYPFNTGDSRLDSLLQATLFDIAEVGYHAATIERICQRAGVSQGFVFGRYTSKLDIFVDATERRAREGFEVNLQFTNRLAREHGSGIAEAVLWREAMRPEHQQARHWAIEQVRLAWHEPVLAHRLRDAEGAFLSERHASLPTSVRDHAMASDRWGIALGVGMVMIAEFFPDAWRLPLDVVTVPAAENTMH